MYAYLRTVIARSGKQRFEAELQDFHKVSSVGWGSTQHHPLKASVADWEGVEGEVNVYSMLSNGLQLLVKPCVSVCVVGW